MVSHKTAGGDLRPSSHVSGRTVSDACEAGDGRFPNDTHHTHGAARTGRRWPLLTARSPSANEAGLAGSAGVGIASRSPEGCQRGEAAPPQPPPKGSAGGLGAWLSSCPQQGWPWVELQGSLIPTTLPPATFFRTLDTGVCPLVLPPWPLRPTIPRDPGCPVTEPAHSIQIGTGCPSGVSSNGGGENLRQIGETWAGNGATLPQPGVLQA